MVKYLLVILMVCVGCSTQKRVQTQPPPPPPQECGDTTVVVEFMDVTPDFDVMVKPTLKLMKKPLTPQNDVAPDEYYDEGIPPAGMANTSKGVKRNTKGAAPKDPGKLVYSIPDTMKVGKMETIRVRINRDTTQHDISEGIVGKEVVIRTTATMDVSLVDPSGNSFLIKKNNDDIMAVETDEYTEWVFDVTPLKHGNGKLNLVVSVVVNGVKKQQVYSDVVYVKIDGGVVVRTWWDKYWQWVFSTLILPFTIWFYNKKKKEK